MDVNVNINRVLDARAVIVAAHRLEGWLYANVGRNADWPVRITCDNDESYEQLRWLLQDLKDSLEPIRAVCTIE